MEYKYTLSVFTIDDDGDLKYEFELQTNESVTCGTTISRMIPDSDGKIVRRIYYKVIDILLPCIDSDDKNVVQCDGLGMVIHCKTIIDEMM